MSMFSNFRMPLLILISATLSGCLSVVERQVRQPIDQIDTVSSREFSDQVVFDRERPEPKSLTGENDASIINQVVVATGIGETPEEAKLDAVRNALSQEFDQLVFVERIVIDENLERDIVISTMNGFISDIEVVSADRDPNGLFVIVASVTLSGSGLENYISRFTSIEKISEVRSRVNADEIAQRLARAKELNTLEAQKRLTQWNSAKALSEKLFTGYPGFTVRARLAELSFNSRVPDILELRFTYQLEQSFTKQLIQQLLLIDQLVTDSGRGSRDYIYMCFATLTRLNASNCARIPEGIVVDRIYGAGNSGALVDLKLVVAVFDQLNRFVDCLSMDVNDGFEEGLNSFQSRSPISRFPDRVVSWVGSNSEVRRISDSKIRFENIIFLNGVSVDKDNKALLQGSWEVSTKAYAPTFFNDKKRIRAEHFYPFLVAKINESFYLGLSNMEKSSKDVNVLCKLEGERRHLRSLGR